MKKKSRYLLFSFNFLQLKNATTGHEKIIGDSLRANPDSLVNNVPEAVEKLKTGSYAFSYVLNVMKSSYVK